jgi:predicted transcriptional regulator
LLIDHERDWKVKDLADRANVAPSYAHQILKALEPDGFVETSDSGPRTYRRLTQPGRLLDDWAGQHSLSQYEAAKYYLWMPKGADSATIIADAFESSGSEHALTAASGALRRAPFVWQESVVTLLVRAGTDFSQTMSALKASSVDDGENVLILATGQESPLMYRQRVDGLWLASDIQLYLDLYAWPQRGREQAAHLRSERLGF